MAAANAGQNTNSTNVAPSRILYNSIDFKDMDTKKKDLLTEITEELEQAQIFDFSSKYRYIKVGLILIRAKKELDLKGEEWKEFYELLGLKEKVEERCRKIAANEWFAALAPEDAIKLSHLTQANMITMSKETDETKFNDMFKEDYDFSTSKAPEATDDEIAEALNVAYTEADLSILTLDTYKTYSAMSVEELIKILDESLQELEESNSDKFYKPQNKSSDITDENQESVKA